MIFGTSFRLDSYFITSPILNPKDHASRRGLLKMIGRRKRLLGFINAAEPTRYQSLIQRLGIRR